MAIHLKYALAVIVFVLSITGLQSQVQISRAGCDEITINKRFYIKNNDLLSQRNLYRLLSASETAEIKTLAKKARRWKSVQVVSCITGFACIGIGLTRGLIQKDRSGIFYDDRLPSQFAGSMLAVGAGFIVTADIARDQKKKHFRKAIRLYNQNL
jgi:hypothetical protein